MYRRCSKISKLLGVLFLSITALPTIMSAQDVNDTEDDPMIADKWFQKQRAYPYDHIPVGARLAALQQAAEMPKAMLPGSGTAGQIQGLAITSATPLSWVQIGPMPVGMQNPISVGGSSGRATALAIDPRNANIIYLGTAGGGVWKTTDAGAHWTPITDSQASLAVGAIVIDPKNSLNIYVGTGEANSSVDSYYGAGLLKSKDGGATWTRISGPFVGENGMGTSFGALAISPSNSSILLAGTYAGVYRSTDAGLTWTQVLFGNTGYSIVFDPTRPNVVYASLSSIWGWSGGGVYKSQDAGVTWTRLYGTGSNVLPLDAGRISVAISPSSPNTLYASVAGDASLGTMTVYKSTDGGANWVPKRNMDPGIWWYTSALAVHPKNPNIVFLGSAYLYRSMDGGNTWEIINFDHGNGVMVHVDMHAIAFTADSSVMYVASDGGAYSTSGSASTSLMWNDFNATIATVTFYPGMAVDRNNVNNIFAGTQDNGMDHYTGSLAWESPSCGDAGYAAIDYVNSNNVYVDCLGTDLLKSTDGGYSFYGVSNSISPDDRRPWVSVLVMDPWNPNALYFGTQRVYYSNNGATSWSPISPDLTNDPLYGDGAVISAIAVAPTHSNAVYVAATDGVVQMTTQVDLGANARWTNITGNLPFRYPTALTVDPNNYMTAYVTFSGFDTGHIFKTVNMGQSWIDISSNLPNSPINTIVIDQDRPSTIYVGTDVGVFVTSNGGVSWSSLMQGLPNVVVNSLALHRSTHTLVAATHGRSAWKINVPPQW